MGLLPPLLAKASAWPPPVIISEFAENKDRLKDAFGNASDWIELQNTTSRPIALSGWSLTDDPTKKSKWSLPDVVLPPWGTRLIWASNANLTDPSGELHTNFALSKNGEYLGLYDADRMLVHDFGAAYPPQYGEHLVRPRPLAVRADGRPRVRRDPGPRALPRRRHARHHVATPVFRRFGLGRRRAPGGLRHKEPRLGTADQHEPAGARAR